MYFHKKGSRRWWDPVPPACNPANTLGGFLAAARAVCRAERCAVRRERRRVRTLVGQRELHDSRVTGRKDAPRTRVRVPVCSLPGRRLGGVPLPAENTLAAPDAHSVPNSLVTGEALVDDTDAAKPLVRNISNKVAREPVPGPSLRAYRGFGRLPAAQFENRDYRWSEPRFIDDYGRPAWRQPSVRAVPYPEVPYSREEAIERGAAPRYVPAAPTTLARLGSAAEYARFAGRRTQPPPPPPVVKRRGRLPSCGRCGKSEDGMSLTIRGSVGYCDSCK
jgi:hypothetical protein